MGPGEPYPAVCQNVGPWNLDAQFITAPNSHTPVQELPISCVTQSFPYYRAKYYVLYEKKKTRHGFCHILAATTFLGAHKMESWKGTTEHKEIF